MGISQFIASFFVGYITSWQLSLVLTAMLPLLGIGGWFMAKAMDQGNASNEAYVNAGAMAQEILKEIKTVASFANFDYEKEKYRGFIEIAMKAGIKQGFKAGFGIGFIVFIVYNSYALAVGYGSYLIANRSTNKNSGNAFGAGEVITVLFSIIFGCFSLGQSTPYINAILSACRSARDLFALLERQPKIDLTTSIEKPDKNSFTGKIIFNNISFSYPSKPNDYVLKNLNISIQPGEKLAIVGESGSGKSTILSLIERLYDPQEGEILFDNYNIKNLDLEYLRSLIGYVPQQPVLLNTSIKENIIFGRTDISDSDIDIAVQNSSAKDFVDIKGLNYNVGSGGKMLSGGQKQRIAIARSIVNKPKILIFDEATSALDNNCEKEVQMTLDEVCKGLSSITVAHRISTIKNSDRIICLDAGKVIEEGTHKELLQKNGFYARLINEDSVIEEEDINLFNIEEEDNINEIVDQEIEKQDDYEYNNIKEIKVLKTDSGIKQNNIGFDFEEDKVENVNKSDDKNNLDHSVNISINGNNYFDEKNHKAHEDFYSNNNSINESCIIVDEEKKKKFGLDVNEYSKHSSLLNTPREKVFKSNRSQKNISNLVPDVELDTINFHKTGYSKINHDGKNNFKENFF